MTENAQREPVCATCDRPFRLDDTAVTIDAHLVHLLCAVQVRRPPAASSPNPPSESTPDRSSSIG